MADFWNWVCNNLGISSATLVLLLITFVQITPIKINPWNAILDFFLAPRQSLKKMEKICEDQEKIHTEITKLQDKFNYIDEIEKSHTLVMESVAKLQILEKSHNGIQAQMKNVSDQLDSIREDREKEKAIAARIRILQFGDEITNSIYHSKEHYEQILKDIELYDQFCENHPSFPNNITVITSKVIKESYKKILLNQIQQTNIQGQ